jgi:hypothetical protein
LEITVDDVLKCVKSLNISSAPGVDAWSYSFLKDLILHGYNFHDIKCSKILS